MKIHLTKPLVFLDIEATGLIIGLDRIVEISLLKVNVNNETEIKTVKVNPEIPIPELVSQIHGIYDKDVIDLPVFKQVAPDLLKFIGNADLAGFNSNKFDVPLLAEEFLRVGLDFDMKGRRLIDVQNIFHYMEPRNLAAAYKFYCDSKIENAHSAEADVTATYEIFKAQLKKYEGLSIEDEKGNSIIPIKNEVGTLSELSARTKNVDLAGRIIYNVKNEEVFSFGKYKDKTVEEVFTKDPSYYSWIMNGDFSLYTKRVVTQIRLRMKNK
ncbi:MAG: 3'-5' exonuclease [Sphingobacteriaceae bacterium]|nr:3'-5' exonuclease [Sphingobacteriaceae bacterium]